MADFNFSFIYKYLPKTKRYFFSNKISNNSAIVQAISAIQVSSDDEKVNYESGISFSDSHHYARYNNFDFHDQKVIMNRVRESAITEDNKVFILKNGAWFSSFSPVVVVYNRDSQTELETDNFIAVPDEGKIILDDEITDDETILVTIPQDKDFKFAAKLESFNDDADLSDVGIMYNNNEKILFTVSSDRKPYVNNIYISPTSPKGGENLYANYVLYDRFGKLVGGNGLSSGVKIYWYQNGVIRSAYEDLTIIPGSAVQRGALWYFQIIPNDGVISGNIYTSDTISVSNGSPRAYNVIITPSEATTENDLVITYNYSDPDGDVEGNTEIRWFRNGILQSQFNQRAAIFSSETSSGQQFYATVRPYDGMSFGNAIKSNVVIIDHTAPTIGNSLTIYPKTPSTNDELSATYNFASSEGLSEFGPFPNWEKDNPDQDYPEGATTINWYKNNVLQEDLNNYSNISSLLTSSGDVFRVEVAPGDGVVRGSAVTSENITIS